MKKLTSILLLVIGLVILSPVPVTASPATKTWISISSGKSYSCGVTKDNTARCWNVRGGDIALPSGLPLVSEVVTSPYREGVCAVTLEENVICWDGNPTQNNVPSGLGRISQVVVGDGGVCSLSRLNAVYCWGERYSESYAYEQQLPANFGKVSKIFAGPYAFCALNSLGDFYCWFVSVSGPPPYQGVEAPGLAESTPKDLGAVTDLALGNGYLCAIGAQSNLRCWDWLGVFNYGQLDVPSNLGQVSQVSVIQEMGCAVTSVGAVRCWGANPGDVKELLPLISNELGEVAEVSVGNRHACVLTVSGAVRCWGDGGTYPLYVPVFVALAKDPSQVELREDGVIQFFHESNGEEDGNLVWRVRDVNSGTLVCELSGKKGSGWKGFYYCDTEGLVVGGEYQYSVQGENEAGKTALVVSTPRMYCPSTINPLFEVTSLKEVVVSGSTTTISGQLVNLCEAPPAKFQWRSKVSGSAWSKWNTGVLNGLGGFAMKQKITFNTVFQVQAVTKRAGIVVGNISVGARTQKALPLTFKWTSTKIKQGFTQGGSVVVTFSGDKAFSGRCVLLGETKAAYNFALRYMGSESKIGSFTVKNGYGTGKLQMTWNGKSNVSALCSSTKFQDVFDFRLPVFKANF